MSWWKYKSMHEMEWKLPKVFSRAMAVSEERDGVTARRIRLVVSWLMCFVGFLLMAAKKFHTPAGLVSIGLVSLLLAAITAYFPMLANRYFSAQVAIGKKAVLLMMPGGGGESWNYAAISEIRFIRDTVFGETFWIMVLHLCNGTRIGLGVAEDMDINAVASCLEKCRVSKVTIESAPSDLAAPS